MGVPVYPYLISSERKSLLLDAVLGNDVKMDPVTSVDLPLSGRDEHIVDDADGLLQTQGVLLHVLHVLEPDLVVQEGLEQGHGGAAGPVHVALHVAHGVVAVQAAAALVIEAAEDV